MTHDELLAEIDFLPLDGLHAWFQPALRAVVELHRPYYMGEACDCCEGSWDCLECSTITYPCPTIQAIEKELG